MKLIETKNQFTENVAKTLLSESSRLTFEYIFDEFKKGIFVQIRRGKVANFLCLDNKYYANNWHSKIDFGNFQFTSKVQEPRHWYANNYLVRYEKPFRASNIGRAELLDMFVSLCSSFDIPDVDFFVNRRDFPIFRKDGKKPYAAIYGPNESAPDFQKAPLLSMVSSEEYLDIPIPTPDDWSRVKGRIFTNTNRNKSSMFVDDFCKDWNQKKDAAVFRGSNTGENFGEMRIRLCELSRGDARLDTKLTSISLRPQIIGGKLREYSADKRTDDLLGSFLSLKQQSEYKYIIHIKGHVQSYRLAAELATYSTLLLVESETYLWFEKKLTPWKHYVPIAADLSDLKQKIDWCEKHDDECRKIALEARSFYEDNLTEEKCLEYLAEVILEIARKTKVPEKSQDEKILKKIDSPLLSSARSYLRTIVLGALDYKKAKITRTIKRTNDTTIQLLDIKGSSCIILKRSRQENLTSEASIGLDCINELVKEIPNFLYTFECDGARLYQEWPSDKAETLEDYIKSQAFRFVCLLSIWKQLAISLEHAQNRCFFIHGRATPENIILYQTFPKKFDYITSDLKIWRCTTENLIPVFADYSFSRAFSETKKYLGRGMQSASAPAFEPFKDCIWFLIKSIYLCFYFKRLKDAEICILIELFNKLFSDVEEVFFPKFKNSREFCNFIYRVHSDEYLLNARFGSAALKSPMILFEAIEDENFRQVEGVEYTHFGNVSSVYLVRHNSSAATQKNLPLLIRYYQQILSRASKGGYSEKYMENNIAPMNNITKGWKISDDISLKHLLPLNICISLLTDGSSFRLSKKEKEELLEKIGIALKRKNTLLTH